MSPAAQAIWCEAYELGVARGVEIGRREVEAEDAARWAVMREFIDAAARMPDIATLQERRGDHARAERTRALWAERGIA